MQRKMSIVFMSGLTLSAINAMNWQIKRYYQSLEKWANINVELEKPLKEEYRVQDLDIQPQYIKDCIFKIVIVEGFLTDHIRLVHRFKDGRDGQMLISSITHNSIGYVINLGWIPQAKVSKIIDKDEFKQAFNKDIRVKCLVRYAENKDEISKGREMNIDTYINLPKFSKDMGLENEVASHIYLERMGDENNDGGLVGILNDEDLSMYPVPLYMDSLEMPYLTPDKHKNYFTFWGGCTLLGIYSIIKLVRG